MGLAWFVAVAVVAGRGAARAASRAAAGATAGVLGSHVWDFYFEALMCPGSARGVHDPPWLARLSCGQESGRRRRSENFAGGCRGEPLGEAFVRAARRTASSDGPDGARMSRLSGGGGHGGIIGRDPSRLKGGAAEPFLGSGPSCRSDSGDRRAAGWHIVPTLLPPAMSNPPHDHHFPRVPDPAHDRRTSPGC